MDILNFTFTKLRQSAKNKDMGQDIQYLFEENPLWRLKLRLQKTGWLQYVPLFILGQVSLILSYFYTFFIPSLASFLSAIGKLFLTVSVLEILTIKFNIRLPEPLPKRLVKEKDNCYIMSIRHSCRSFQPRKLHQNDLEEVLQIAKIEAKETFGTAPIRFEYVNSPMRVWPAVNASEFLVAIGPADYNRTSIIDIGHSLQAVVLHATKLGLGTCWIGPGADHDSVLDALKRKGAFNKERDHIVCVCAIGYKSMLVPLFIRLTVGIMSHHRKPRSELFFADLGLQTPFDTTKYPFSKFEKCYEAARWSPSSYNAQPTRCVGFQLSEDKVRFDFFTTTKSRYYAPVAVGIWLRNWQAACEAIGIKGRFATLTKKERQIEEDAILPALPAYEMSWIQD